MRAPIILAVDTSDLDIAKRWVAATSDSISLYKLGLEFYLTFGADGVAAIKAETDSEIFLDLKLHDIPHTVAGAATAIAHLRPKFLTVHAAGGVQMVAAAVSAAPDTDITAVTILTSLSDQELFDIGYASPALESAVALAKLSVKGGARAIVCSPLEIGAIRAVVGVETKIITPGVRPASDAVSDDQKRTMTPREAISAGADYVVIGRPITGSWSQGEMALTAKARYIADEILN
jgi:orotidine-5'-phosphate decarboxylase